MSYAGPVFPLTLAQENDALTAAREITLDFVGKKPGRGAYVCPSRECLAKARKSRALERAFSTQIPPEVYAALEQQMEAADG